MSSNRTLFPLTEVVWFVFFLSWRQKCTNSLCKKCKHVLSYLLSKEINSLKITVKILARVHFLLSHVLHKFVNDF